MVFVSSIYNPTKLKDFQCFYESSKAKGKLIFLLLMAMSYNNQLGDIDCHSIDWFL